MSCPGKGGGMKPVYINNFQMVKPRNRFDQNDLLSWIAKVHKIGESFVSQNENEIQVIDRLFLRYGVKSSLISQRYFECDDVSLEKFQAETIYNISKEHPNGVDILERAKFFSDRAFEVMQRFYSLETKTKRPDHLIHVTCTGYISPSAAQRAVAHANWGSDTEVTHAYHMGCYASLPSIRLAKSLVLSNNDSFSVDVIHNEMCGLHMNVLNHTAEQMIVQTLFADGHAKYSLSASRVPNNSNLKILAILEKLIPDSDLDMSWVSASHGMQMNLSREVPAKIKFHIRDFASQLLSKAQVSVDCIKNMMFAIHPGGPKIIETVKEALELAENQITESQKILFERGNMSSATLPHIWQLILEKEYPPGTKVVSFAFGPGLTVFGAVFEVS